MTTPPAHPDDLIARGRVVLEDLTPGVDGGRFAICRTIGELVAVELDAFADGHDLLHVELCHRRLGDGDWASTPMRELGNDRWAGEFAVTELGVYEYGARAWIDAFGTWRRGLERNADAGNDVSVDILIGAELIRAAAGRAGRGAAKRLRAWAAELADETTPIPERVARTLDDGLTELCRAHADRTHQTAWDHPYRVRAERERARFSAWYELFPRSAAARSRARHGTLRDVAARLD